MAAVVSLGTSYGQRLRRVAEVTVGVAIGVFTADVFTHYLGSGAWQLTLIVALAMSTALLLDAGAIFVTQAAVQSIVVSVLLPDPGAAFTRWTVPTPTPTFRATALIPVPLASSLRMAFSVAWSTAPPP